MTVGSEFSGIEGFGLGFERIGMQLRWQIEVDPFCRRVLEKHWPHVPKHGDIRNVGSELEYVDVLCGGFPCQDLSNAGKRAGITGERSGLWREMVRTVRVVRPKYVVVENVAAILGRGLGTVLGDLADSGYDCEWDCLPASAFGAPHRRERFFAVAYPDDQGLERHRVLTERPRKLPTWQGVEEQDWTEYPTRCLGMVDGVPSRVDRIKSCGNAVIPIAAEYLGQAILAADYAESARQSELKVLTTDRAVPTM